jgi:heat shock protein HslJ
MRSYAARPGTVIATFVLAVTVCGCGTKYGPSGETIHPSPTAAMPTSVTGTDWVLTRIGGAAAQPRELSGRPWFRLDPSDKRRVTGNTGVNLLNGTYELSGGALQFGPLITTRRAGEPALMEQESRFLKALESTATTDLRGRSLRLRDAGKAPLAEFEASDVGR